MAGVDDGGGGGGGGVATATADDYRAWEEYKSRVDRENFSDDLFKRVRNDMRLQLYYRMANQAFQQGQQNYGIGEHFDAYVFLKRAALLLGHIIPRHNAYRTAAYAPDMRRGRRTLATALEHAEAARAALKEEYVGRRVEAREAAAGGGRGG
eukprot:CAMPEP_0203806434 /NCGR_PEP_ID=MMETSP0115-20131106/476_1 /ASSEMBLY_ACC=CAM_ASM_000227 /TAXON_ID=33651 /ORGANISM="Bicosoecid sp, Strain ms1" /LENGTH=151 /DNA_ID=CAMNT_0050715091 /DNA_START=257 /DNA_END=708 /DNA_ORIENTATION=-